MYNILPPLTIRLRNKEGRFPIWNTYRLKTVVWNGWDMNMRFTITKHTQSQKAFGSRIVWHRIPCIKQRVYEKVLFMKTSSQSSVTLTILGRWFFGIQNTIFLADVVQSRCWVFSLSLSSSSRKGNRAPIPARIFNLNVKPVVIKYIKIILFIYALIHSRLFQHLKQMWFSCSAPFESHILHGFM